MPNTTIAIFLHRRASPSFALIAASIFRTANRLSTTPTFDVKLVGHEEHFVFQDGMLKLELVSAVTPDYFIIPPIEGFDGVYMPDDDDMAALALIAASDTVIASACLGAFLPAAAGLLDGQAATTHWAWADFAARRFPDVRWNSREMLIESSRMITAGGLFSIVDLCLHLVANICGTAFAGRLARHMLADTMRQKQSAYATQLLAAPREKTTFAALEAEIAHRQPNTLTVAEMASISGMSLRTFHRRFLDVYGVTPVKYVQLRKVEIAKELLISTSKPLEEIAEQAGFGDLAFFRNVFARETGMTPGQFRKRSTGAAPAKSDAVNLK